MPAATIRSDQDELAQIGQTFSKASSAIAGVNRKIKSSQDTLEGGDWIGKGATAFFKEMNSDVFPAMKRLESAMSEAARITKQVAKLMKQAEDDASRLFRIS